MNVHAAFTAAPPVLDSSGTMKKVVWADTALALTIVMSAFALAFASVLKATDGSFTYMLDDPYIHLSMAEQILRGEYGINPGEPAAASSSILYPYLLAALMALGAGIYAPLTVNLASVTGMVIVVAIILRELAGAPSPARIAQRAVIIAAFCLCLNVVALAFSGMENGLHMTLTAAGVLGLLVLHRTGRAPPWWLAVLSVTPLVRYEGTGLLLAGVLVLVLNRRGGTALLVAGSSLLCLAGFSLYLHSLGLPLLPSSVLVKGEETIGSSSAGLIAGLMANMLYSLTLRDGMVLLACTVFLGWRLVRAGKTPRGWADLPFQVALFGMIGTAGHLVLGKFQSFDRYAAYALALGLLSVIVLEARAARLVLLRGRIGLTGATVLGLAFLFPANIAQSMRVGICGANVYLQQYQVHRFATEFWSGPIAVNDIGWPSFRNENYVLDLWGLGSEKARQARRLSSPVEGLAALAEERDVHVAAVYDDWFLQRPTRWVAVARLKLEVELVSAGGDTVTFYATRAEHAAPLRDGLEAFGRTLPNGASLHFD